MYDLLRSRGGAQDNSTVFWGYVLVCVSFVWFIVMMFNVVGSKFVSHTGNPLVDFLATDWYYSQLLVLTVPVTIIAVVLNWMSMKFFRHN